MDRRNLAISLLMLPLASKADDTAVQGWFRPWRRTQENRLGADGVVGLPTAAHQKLLRCWSDNKADILLQPAAEEAVGAVETKYGIQLPPAFRAYLLEACPADDQLDHNCTEWWSLRRIKNIPDEYEHELTNADIAKDAAGFLFFADYMFWCMAWAICCQPGENYGRVAVISGEHRFVANTFAEFIDRYVQDHNKLL
jgi:hypothetical protein